MNPNDDMRQPQSEIPRSPIGATPQGTTPGDPRTTGGSARPAGSRRRRFIWLTGGLAVTAVVGIAATLGVAQGSVISGTAVAANVNVPAAAPAVPGQTGSSGGSTGSGSTGGLGSSGQFGGLG